MTRKVAVLVSILALLAIGLVFGLGKVAAVDGGNIQHFMDSSRQTTFSVHSDSADPDYGEFSFDVPGVGTYVGGGRDSIKPTANGKGVSINFKGAVQLMAAPGSNLPPGRRTVNLNAQVGPVTGHATAVLIDAGKFYQMISHAPGANAEVAVKGVANAFKNRDWKSLYDLTSSTFTEGKTVEAFAAESVAQEAQLGRVVQVDLLSKPNVQFSPQGVWFFTVRTHVTFDMGGTTRTQDFTDYYLLEGDQWKFWLSAND